MQINANSTILVPPGSIPEAAPVSRPLQESSDVAEARDNFQGGELHSRRALGVFRQELRHSLKMHFHARFASTQQNYMENATPVSADDVAAETLGTAKQIVSAAPMRSSRAIISMRASVHEAASYAQQTVASGDDATDLDAAVAKIGDGLDQMADEAAAVQESRSSVLDVNMRTRQRTSIRIRTQEGDIVRFNLKQVDKLSASDVAVSNEDGEASSTAVEMSSRSRMSVRVKGDLNESEMAAIKTVFEQAQQMADDFFGGDIAAAFDAAQGFEYDAEQLARVNLRFRMRQVSNISYTETVTTQQRPVIESPAEPAQAAAPALAPARPEAAPRADLPVEPVVADKPRVEAVVDEAPAAEPPALDGNALSGFFDLVSDFLRSVGDGFDYASGGSSIRLHYSESFKLELLRTVISTTAPAGAENAAATADAIIGSVANTTGDAGDEQA